MDAFVIKVDYKAALHRASTQKVSVMESNFDSKTLNTTLSHFESTYLVRDIAIAQSNAPFIHTSLSTLLCLIVRGGIKWAGWVFSKIFINWHGNKLG